MAVCEVCGNDYDKAIEIAVGGANPARSASRSMPC